MKKIAVICFALCTQYSFAQWPSQTIIIQQRSGINSMQGPINYTTNIQSPIDAARQGFELGRAMREEEERRSRAEQQRAEQESSRAQAMQVQRLLTEQMAQMQQQQKLLEAQADELRRLREAASPQK